MLELIFCKLFISVLVVLVRNGNGFIVLLVVSGNNILVLKKNSVVGISRVQMVMMFSSSGIYIIRFVSRQQIIDCYIRVGKCLLGWLVNYVLKNVVGIGRINRIFIVMLFRLSIVFISILEQVLNIVIFDRLLISISRQQLKVLVLNSVLQLVRSLVCGVFFGCVFGIYFVMLKVILVYRISRKVQQVCQFYRVLRMLLSSGVISGLIRIFIFNRLLV